MIRRIVITAVTLAMLVSQPAFAVEPDEILADPVLEERARAISKQVRCVVCQNQDIDSSNAGVARDLRLLVRERLVAGDTDQQVMDFLVARYGDYVLFNPPWKPSTYILWVAPIVILGLGGIATAAVLTQNARRYRKSRKQETERGASEERNPENHSLTEPHA
ncbi:MULTISPECIES: cytochrome c-type biogenesis protein [unclassified Ruegeria]|jgi:cytochrome c-type biogenesis protein CcmH|uniref:cytochrome c-type biogenesis protein n=2 Tax=Roseobacteraceae TaxID=2854170 RepID=UPI00147BBAE3|nr:cytochrome c-type biogenesis protein CcmH [Ruegeria sp. R13_0]NOC47412.1 cytochrome c-type biogenesis protein CcmH [Ruegeria sp. HKCCD7559]NOD49569.1 cytochrome c-type biogenesis protein CcmH [Ruegeria sp. HKCCD5849]NOD54077.1 cytochrome c-type biogenesis protein CcmH [Ruegeria sp. HKCCD5851]NOD69897.1 cytochrome c-type biogenesis protein CcmH [Ruegeria sp. HKCCD7303]UAB91061.1 cytochrome c-type biogenesis protein CcmH [Ruegeria sp. SCSIO 43209]